MNKKVFFFIGTEAEFIKVFPVIIACEKKGLDVKIISSGQNDISKSRIWEVLPKQKIDLLLSEEKNIKKSAVGLVKWFLQMNKVAWKRVKDKFGQENLTEAPMVVHGDTVSTVLGARIGKKLGMKVCHVEAGLRSYNLLNPFPEEIDRLLTSRLAEYHFAPGKEPANNLEKAKGQVIDTRYNTIIDSLAVSEQMEVRNEAVKEVIAQEYFVFVMHRQENLMNTDFFVKCIESVERLAENIKCVMILHTPTKIELEKIGKLDALEKNSSFILLPRIDYFDFMKVLNGAKFVITDGGSNQEELAYMGKPTLIMRKKTERQDGIGENAHLYDGDVEKIIKLECIYKNWIRDKVIVKDFPSEIIANTLLGI